ncbi:TetR/AcrR family transcriptional regulator [Ferdinandcohnia quinoae]|uniref:TetR/AcrR family transcriptional regulator n=1 Tax=Fredinandcohnia quinoae TaxID=2918902 RepID=A0AAW5ED14_9BACI|nr:TetR/AcrR family transcriptional regulator [Fredinandcohnia sp. SECRCQ15]MCH1627048.1 TetR/AcrR family transcriptional regulator [Fredinandcohnia sp. SECRCQ15]
MPPRKKFSKGKIIDSAFEIARIEGLESITIRKVAEKLGSSIAPIYVNFETVDELKAEVVKKTFGVSHQLLMEHDTGNPFRDIGIASLRFAKEYSVLFMDLVMKQNEYMNDYDETMGKDLVELMKKDTALKDFTDKELMEILKKMRIFQVGLSVMVANGLLSVDVNEEMILESTANDIILAAKQRKKGE